MIQAVEDHTHTILNSVSVEECCPTKHLSTEFIVLFREAVVYHYYLPKGIPVSLDNDI
jgi:hypothetical protein